MALSPLATPHLGHEPQLIVSSAPLGRPAWIAHTPQDAALIQRRLHLPVGSVVYRAEQIGDLPLLLLRGLATTLPWTPQAALSALISAERRELTSELPWIDGLLSNDEPGDALDGIPETGLKSTLLAHLLAHFRLRRWQSGAQLWKDLRRSGHWPGQSPRWSAAPPQLNLLTWRRHWRIGVRRTCVQSTYWNSGETAVIIRQRLDYREGPGFDPRLNAGHQLRITLKVA